MSFTAEIDALLAADDIQAAIDACKTRLKSVPSDQEARHLYIDLLILDGDYERADTQCGIAATLEPTRVMGLATLRHHLRGFTARNAWFETGAVPEFPGGPTELDRLALRIAVADRAGDREATLVALAEFEEARGEREAVVDGLRVADFRDLDDRIPHALEVIMSGGAYLWVDFTKVSRLTPEPLRQLRDLAFRPAQLTLTDGATAPVLIPTIYYSAARQDASTRLGRSTEWLETATGLTIGSGQRCFLSGDGMVALHDMRTLEINTTEEAVDG